MANNNNQLFDAALMAFFSASNFNRGIPTPIPAAEVTAAQAFATEVDSLIPADGTITTPVTSATLQKVNLLKDLCLGALADRSSLQSVATNYLTLATSIAAAYNQAVALLALP